MATPMTPRLTLVEGKWSPIELPAQADALSAEGWQREGSRIARMLRREMRLNRKPLRFRRGNSFLIRSDGIAGVIPIASEELVVLPKFLEHESAETWHRAMDGFASRVRERDKRLLKADRQDRGLFELRECLARAFCDAVTAAAKHDPLTGYRSAILVQKTLRGQVIIDQLVQRLISRPGEFVCRVSERSLDTELNRLLHWAASQIIEWDVDSRTKHAARTAAQLLPDLPRRRRPLRPLAVPRHHLAWRDAVETANAILIDSGRAFGGRGVGYGYVLNGAYAFEAFVEESLLNACQRNRKSRFTSVPQERFLFATPAYQRGKPHYLRPDNIIYRDNSPVAVVDAKYKTSKNGYRPVKPSAADFYQVYTAAQAVDVRLGVLVYPGGSRGFSPGQATRRRAWTTTDTRGVRTVIGAVELNLPLLAAPNGLTALDDALIMDVRALLDLLDQAPEGRP